MGIFNQRTLRNAASLIVLQGGNYILPLVMLPYLARALGIQVFGSWLLAGATVSIARTAVGYGFDLTATRAASGNRTNASFTSQLFFAVTLSRLAILVICSATVIVASQFIHSLQPVLVLTLASMLVLVGEALFPVWLFQGRECMGTITKLRLSYRFAFVLAVIVAVRRPADVFLVPILEGIGSIATGAVACFIARSRFGLIAAAPSSGFIWRHFVESTTVFASTMAVHFYTTLNTMALGATSGSVAVAQYAIPEKIYSAIRGLLSPLIQAIYPALAAQRTQSPRQFSRSAVLLLVFCFLILASLAICVYIFAGNIISLISGHHLPLAESTLRIFAFALCFGMGSILSPLLIVQERSRTLLTCTTVTAIVGVAACVVLVPTFGVVGAAFAFLTSQVVNTLLLLGAAWPTLHDTEAEPLTAVQSEIQC